MKINKLIKKAREEKGMSQGMLARKLGYGSGQFISNIERNRAPLPLVKFKMVARALDISMKKLADARVRGDKAKVYRKLGLYCAE
jgi:ribosome-binding protein aMBF1 (putative translation factor)